MADHNDSNAVNSIFSDIDISAADELTAKEMRHYSWLELRNNFSTQAALAWALYRAGGHR